MVGASAVWDKPVTPTCLFAVSGVCGVWSVVLCSDDRTWRAGLGSVFLSFCLSVFLAACVSVCFRCSYEAWAQLEDVQRTSVGERCLAKQQAFTTRTDHTSPLLPPSASATTTTTTRKKARSNRRHRQALQSTIPTVCLSQGRRPAPTALARKKKNAKIAESDNT